MKQSVGNNTDPNVNSLDIVLYIGDSFLDVLQWCIIRELLASIINLALNRSKAIIDFLEFSFQILNILADCGEAGLNISERVSVRTIVSCHALEVAREDALLA